MSRLMLFLTTVERPHPTVEIELQNVHTGSINTVREWLLLADSVEKVDSSRQPPILSAENVFLRVATPNLSPESHAQSKDFQSQARTFLSWKPWPTFSTESADCCTSRRAEIVAQRPTVS
ncbi:hypothetical protein [Pseudomonas sp. GM78]|uniref:hypothetical protein n=1 Tax=Pseudomonas sp. GM78 TaxID=1144337 RepID=UPI0012FCB85B|nr:hypothetical protein [Pseudomonas sp. GM78]